MCFLLLFNINFGEGCVPGNVYIGKFNFFFRITNFSEFVSPVGKPYVWVQRISGLDFLPEELHVRNDGL